MCDLYGIFARQIQLLGTKYCLDRLGRIVNRQIGIYTCHGHGYSQGFSYQQNGQIVFHHSVCLSLAKAENVTESIFDMDEINDPNILLPDTNTTNHVVLSECGPYNGTKWNYDERVNYSLNFINIIIISANFLLIHIFLTVKL